MTEPCDNCADRRNKNRLRDLAVLMSLAHNLYDFISRVLR